MHHSDSTNVHRNPDRTKGTRTDGYRLSRILAGVGRSRLGWKPPSAPCLGSDLAHMAEPRKFLLPQPWSSSGRTRCCLAPVGQCVLHSGTPQVQREQRCRGKKGQLPAPAGEVRDLGGQTVLFPVGFVETVLISEKLRQRRVIVRLWVALDLRSRQGSGLGKWWSSKPPTHPPWSEEGRSDWPSSGQVSALVQSVMATGAGQSS